MNLSSGQPIDESVPAQSDGCTPTPDQVNARGTSVIGAGGDATYNATGKGSSVQDNRTIVIVNETRGSDNPKLTQEEANRAFEDYANQIQNMYGRLDLEALIPTTEGEHPKVELREVFVAPLLRSDPPRVELPVELHRRLVECGELPDSKVEVPDVPGVNREVWERARQAYRERPAVDLLDTLADREASNLVLLGDPGAGKSTLARYMALALTLKPLAGPLRALSGLLPVVIELRRYADADWREKSFEDFLSYIYKHEGHAPSPDLLHHCLTTGRAIVIFDGLDELFDPRVRDDVTRRIRGFSSHYPGIRVVVTSRIIGYNRHTLETADFNHYMIQSLDDQQITEFTKRWYEAVCPSNKQEAERLQTRLIDAIDRSRPVRELAGNPLLLTILAIIARRQRLPRDRAGVYQHAVNVLISHWDEDAKHLDLAPDIRAIADLDDRDRREMLECLARHMQNGENGIAGNNVLGEDVEQVFSQYLRDTLQLEVAPARSVSRAMVKQFRERNFILSLYGSQVYGFVHRAFLEYLAASDIVRRYEQRELTDEQLLDGVFAKHAADPAWHEVLLLIIGQLGEKVAAPAIDRILTLDTGGSTKVTDDSAEILAPPAVLALRALAEVRRVGALGDQSFRTAEALTNYWDRHHVVHPSIAADTDASLNSLGPQWSGSRYIRRWLHTSGGGIRSSAAAYGLFTHRDVLLAIASKAWQPAARAIALNQLARKWTDDADMRQIIATMAQQSNHGLVRHEALNSLADNWEGDLGVREIIEQSAVKDPHKDVRTESLVVLASHWPDDPEVQELIAKRVVDEPHEDARGEAVDLLASVWSKEAGLCELMRQRSSEDRHQEVRARALEALAEHWKDQPGVLELLKERAREDPHEYIRSRSLAFLGRSWSGDSLVRDLIMSRATEDPHEHVRSDALDALADQWSDDATVFNFVKDRASMDQHDYVRRWALVTLADHWAKDFGVVDFLKDRAADDPHESVRSETLESLSNSWPRDQAIRDFIKARSLEDDHEQVRAKALAALGNTWPDEPGMREFVESRITEDPLESVRARATVVLAQCWDVTPVTEKLVKSLHAQALHDNSNLFQETLLTHLTKAPQILVRIASARLLAVLFSGSSQVVETLREQADNDPDPQVRRSIHDAAEMANAYGPLLDQLW